MKWYTQTNGVVCIGTENLCFANFHLATDVVSKNTVDTPVTLTDINLIGSYPEDWSDDQQIEEKINRIAKRRFQDIEQLEIA